MKIRLSANRISLVEFLFIAYLGAVYLLPAVQIEEILILGILIMYAVFLIIVDKRLRSPIFSFLLLVFLLAFAYALLTDAVSIASDAENRVLKRFISKTYQYTSLYFPAIIFMRVSFAGSMRQKNILIALSIALLIFVVTNTWFFLIQNPKATREWEYFAENADMNVANYYFICAFPTVVAIIAACIVKLKAVHKMLPVVALALSVGFLFKAQYTLSILISVIAICYQILKSIRLPSTKFLFGVAMVLFALFLPQILLLVIDTLGSSSVAVRLKEVYDFLVGDGADGYNLSSRLTLYRKTIAAFLASPIVGNRTLGFDGHATFLTVLADTGVVGGIPFYLLLRLIYKSVSSKLGVLKKQYQTVLLAFVLMGLTNPIHASLPLGFLTWFFSPLVILVFFREEKSHEISLQD